jgi:preprotein translocase subunit SecA
MTLTDVALVLPRPGPIWGAYPIRAADDAAPPWRRPQWARLLRTPLSQARRVARLARRSADAWPGLDEPQRQQALQAVRQRLRREGLAAAAVAQALGLVSACAAQTLGLIPRLTQLIAAAALLDQRMAEMATGEGKTLALALAAAVAALAGMPVHLVTANEYLAARDAQKMAPLYAALGLRTVALPANSAGADDAARRTAYEHDIVYATARELAFDFLRDRLALGARQPAEHLAAVLQGVPAPQPLMRGLCMALLDEADSILLDEADVPLILSRSVPQAARRAFLWQALALARQLERGRDFTVDAAERQATLTAAGEHRLAALAAPLGGPWQRPRYRREAVNVALAALHACQRDVHYVVRDGAIELLDEVTGRIATGRVWSRGLHTVVALKEGLNPPAETDTVAQITFQRFFQRYWRVAGLSGTLLEARHELRDVLGARVVRIPLHAPCLRRQLPPRVFDSEQARWLAVCERVGALRQAGRPVLIGTDSVGDSQALSQILHADGIEHCVLNALHDADESAIVAQAGRAGQVTVATRMAGRGTDIEIDAAASDAGGLHVLSCQDNPSRRLDRQLAGRAGRHGDIGSEEAWFLRRISHPAIGPVKGTLSGWRSPLDNPMPPRLALTMKRWSQWREERRRAAWRRELLRQDRHWERRLSFAGPPA